MLEFNFERKIVSVLGWKMNVYSRCDFICLHFIIFGKVTIWEKWWNLLKKQFSLHNDATIINK